jgi:hypothetical protein
MNTSNMIGGQNGILTSMPPRIEEDSYEDQASMISKGIQHNVDTHGKRSASSKGKLESLGGSAGGGITRPVQVTVTLEERLKKPLY